MFPDSFGQQLIWANWLLKYVLDLLLIPVACELNCVLVSDSPVYRKYHTQEKLGEILVYANVALIGALNKKRLMTVKTLQKLERKWKFEKKRFFLNVTGLWAISKEICIQFEIKLHY